tara:strand:+ start:3974 stop:5311 length:1338 start_codon:yes stop_codon:yes gene_type:complete
LKIDFKYKQTKKNISQKINIEIDKKNYQFVSSVQKKTNLSYSSLIDIWDISHMNGESPKSQTNLEKEVKVVDLFCGSGGFTQGVKNGLKQLGINSKVLAACDLDKNALKIYELNHQPDLSLNDDVNSIINYQIRKDSSNKPYLENVKYKTNNLATVETLLKGCDILLAGPPCQGHSNLNNHSRGSDPRNNLYLSVAAFAKKLKPSFIAIENVSTVLADHKSVVYKTELLLQNLGYFTEHLKIQGEKIGLPQSRNRHFLIAKKHKSIPSGSFIKQISSLYPKPRNVKWAFENINLIKKQNHSFYNPADVSKENKKRMEWLINNNEYDLPNHLRPVCHQNGTTYKSVYGRLHPQSPSVTITTGFMSPGRGRFTHPFEARALTTFEASILQGFPTNYKFFEEDNYPGNSHLARIIGDAVSPYMSKLIGLNFGIDLLIKIDELISNKAA